MIVLPFPPSVNGYWRNVKGRTLISKRGRSYRKAVADAALVKRFPKFGTARLSVCIMAYPKDRRKRDLDNLLKAVLDSLEYAGVYSDDEQIDDLRIVRCEPSDTPRVAVEICQA